MQDKLDTDAKRQRLEEATTPLTPPSSSVAKCSTISPTVPSTSSMPSFVVFLVLDPVAFIMNPPQLSAEPGKEMVVRMLSEEQVKSLRSLLPGEEPFRGTHVKFDESSRTYSLTDKPLNYKDARHVKASDIARHIRGAGQNIEKRILVFKIKKIFHSSKLHSPWRLLSGHIMGEDGSEIDTEYPVSVKFLKGPPADLGVIEEDDELVFFAFKMTKERYNGKHCLSIICSNDFSTSFGMPNIFFFLKKRGTTKSEILQKGFFL